MSLPPQLGRLRRVRRLGAGGFASVWLYHDDELDSDVAVKALADNWAQDAGVRERFLAESRLLRRAESDHLVHVHDVGLTDDDTPYFVMTYADRGSVADLLAARPCGPDEVVDIVTQAARGLAALHARDIVHRDIKPQNLLLASRPDGSVKVVVADLGVAKALTVDSGATIHVGTAAYAAPEQSDPAVLPDQRADVHGLGAVAYALITGRPPRPGPQGPVPPSALLPGVPAEVDRVVLTALQPDREHRWPDVMSFAQALAAAVGGDTAPAGPPAPAPGPGPSAPAAPRPAGRTRRWAVSALVLGLVAACAGLGLLLLRGGGISGEGAFEDAAVAYVSALRSPDCETELVHLPESDLTLDPAELCSDANLHWRLAQCIDPDEGERRVVAIGDDRARVLFGDQGYVEIVRGDDTVLQAGYMVGCMSEDG